MSTPTVEIVDRRPTVAIRRGTSVTVRRQVVSVGVSQTGPRVVTVPRGRTGEQGPPGTGAAPIEIVSHEAITAGQPIRVRATTGKGSPAQANAIATADVFGFATNSVGADATIEVTRDRVTVSDWTAIAGTEFLTPGQTYFLSPTVAGGIQTTPPTTAGQVACVVGEALTTTTLAVQIGIPILL